MDTPLQRSHPALIIIRGIPGSGKTYLAKKLVDSIKEPVVMLDPDATDYDSKEYADHVAEQTAAGVDPKLHAYRFLRAQAHRGIENHDIIVWNQPFTNLEIFHKMMNNLRTHASEHDTEFALLVIEVEVDAEIAKQRMIERKQAGGHGPSDEIFERFVNDYKSYSNEGFNTLTIDGSGDIDTSVAKVLDALHALWQTSEQ